MRTNEERLAALHTRVAELEREKSKKQVYLSGALSIVACVVLVALLTAIIPHFPADLANGTAAPGLSGSIFANNGALGYIVISIVAFMFGISVTIFCFKLRKWRDGSKNEDRK